MSPHCTIAFSSTWDNPTSGFDAIACAMTIIEQGNKIFPINEVVETYSTSLPDLAVNILSHDSAKLINSDRKSFPYDVSNPASQYPASFRIPPTTLVGLSDQDRNMRARRFAVGSLIYEIMTSEPLFTRLNESAIQENFERGIFPKVTEFPVGIAVGVLGFWSLEFAQELARQMEEMSELSNASFLFRNEFSVFLTL